MRLITRAAAVVLTALLTAVVPGVGASRAAVPVDAQPPARARVVAVDPLAAATRHSDVVRRELGLGPRQRLVVRDVVRDDDGTTHTRYDRTFRGLPVLAGDLVVHRTPAGKVTGVDWAGPADITGLADVTPRLSARTVATDMRRSLPEGFTRMQGLTSVAPELMVDNHLDRARLVWLVRSIAGEGAAPLRGRVDVVDADTGRRILGWSLTHGVDGTGNTYFSGVVTLSTTTVTGGYALRDARRGGSTTRNGDPFSRSPVFRDSDNSWGNGRLDNKRTVAADVHHGVQMAWDYYRSAHGRRGFAGNGNGIRAYVATGGQRNAFWMDECRCLVIVDGDRGRPFAETAVIGHEFTHGVISKTARLEYFGESGGLNESTADIFGTMTEWYADTATASTDDGDYWLGEGSERGRRTPFIRRMDRPGADGHSVGCWRQGVGRLDVHYSSGIGNKFFYLLAEGTGRTRFADLPHNGRSCNGVELAGVGRNRAAQVWYRALTRYMVSTTSYREARDATIRAARDLYGARSRTCRVVTRTWNAVRVPALDWTCSGRDQHGPNQVRNPGFEQGRDHWTGTFGHRGVQILRRPAVAHHGKRLLLLGGSSRPTEAWVAQQVRVPSTRSATMRAWVMVDSGYAGREVHDTLRIEVQTGGRTVVLKRLTNRAADATYQRLQVGLGRWRGDSVQVRFHSIETQRDQTFWLVDDVSVTPR